MSRRGGRDQGEVDRRWDGGPKGSENFTSREGVKEKSPQEEINKAIMENLEVLRIVNCAGEGKEVEKE